MYEKYSTRGVSRGKYSTQLHLVLYLPLDTPPRAVFPVHTRGSALTIPYSTFLLEFYITIYIFAYYDNHEILYHDISYITIIVALLHTMYVLTLQP